LLVDDGALTPRQQHLSARSGCSDTLRCPNSSGQPEQKGSGVEFRILGPLEVVGTIPVDLTGQRERALLARLLLSTTRSCPPSG
jgi:hypothetical protein